MWLRHIKRATNIQQTLLNKTLKALEDEVAALRDARSASLERIEKTEATIARSIGEAAGRIEAIADGLSRSVKPAES